MAKTLSPRQAGHTSESRQSTVKVVSSEPAPAYYTNNTAVETTLWDIRLKFAETVALDKEHNITHVREVASVRMSPQHARVVVGILTGHLENYERQYGPIPSPPKEKAE